MNFHFNTISSRNFSATLSPMTTAHNNKNLSFHDEQNDVVHATLKDIRTTLQQTKTLPTQQQSLTPQNPTNRDDDLNIAKNIDRNGSNSPVWLPRHHHSQPRSQSRESMNSENPSKPLSIDEEEADTDLETDRLLGQQRLDDHGFYDEKIKVFWIRLANIPTQEINLIFIILLNV